MEYTSRTEWGATPPKKPFSRLRPSRVEGIVLHHSGVRNGPKGHDAARAFESYHLSKKWSGIAYNWMVTETGEVLEGRGAGAVSAATKGWNSRTESICFTGWGSEAVPETALHSIKKTIAWIQERYGNGLWVKPHKALGNSSCPGTYLINWLAEGQPTKDTWNKQARPFDWTVVDMPQGQLSRSISLLDRLGEQIRHSPVSRRQRSRGETVRAIQVRLKEKGYDPGVADGIAGPLFESATKAFQVSCAWLKPDGVVDHRTFHALFIQ